MIFSKDDEIYGIESTQGLKVIISQGVEAMVVSMKKKGNKEKGNSS